VCSVIKVVLASLIAIGSVLRAHASPPQRIVSLNLCIDQMLLDLVPRGRIAALSFLVQDPAMSPRVAEAEGIPTVRGEAEEILALDPDLVLAGTWSTPATVSLLERLGRRVVKVPMASSFAEIREAVRIMGETVGEPERAATMIEDFDRRLAKATGQASSARPTAVAMQVNSLASGPGSLVDEVLTAGGFDNIARVAESEGKLGPGGRLPLETLLLAPPDVIVLANSPADFRTVLGDNLRHPALTRLAAGRPSVHLPMRTWLCGTPAIVEAVEKLAALRAALADGKRSAP
jgi:iron complex transport system substrate-binding protein